MKREGEEEKKIIGSKRKRTKVYERQTQREEGKGLRGGKGKGRASRKCNGEGDLAYTISENSLVKKSVPPFLYILLLYPFTFTLTFTFTFAMSFKLYFHFRFFFSFSAVISSLFYCFFSY